MLYFKQLRRALDYVGHDPQVDKAYEILRGLKYSGKTVFLAGNGGSAATASHIANDLTKMGGLKAVALNDLVPLMTANGNDHGWHRMFADTLEQMTVNVDSFVFIGISCSGKSRNVLEAFYQTYLNDGVSIGMTGHLGGWISDARAPIGCVVKVPHSDIRIQEDVHLAIGHYWAGRLRDE